MIYKDYTERSRRLRCEMDALDREFIADYPQKMLLGKVVVVRYRFRGRTHTQTAYFEKLEPFCHDICPVFKVLREDGRPSKMRVSNIYSLKQIESIIAKS